MKTRILAALVALVLLALPLCGLAEETTTTLAETHAELFTAMADNSVTGQIIAKGHEDGNKLAYSIAYSSDIAQELGESYAEVQNILDALVIYGSIQKDTLGHRQSMTINLRDKDIVTLDALFGDKAAYIASNLIGERKLELSYDALNALINSMVESQIATAEADYAGIDPTLALPYLIPVLNWLQTKAVPVVEENDVATEQHPSAVMRQTMTLTAADFIELVDAICTQALADDALQQALVEQAETETTVEAIQEEIATFQKQANEALAGIETFEMMALLDAEGSLLSQSIVVTATFDDIAYDLEMVSHHMVVEGATQNTFDMLIAAGEQVARAYFTTEEQVISETETEKVSLVNVLFGFDHMIDEETGSLRFDISAEITSGETVETTDMEIAFTAGGATYDALFNELGFDQTHAFFITGTQTATLTDEGGIIESTTVLSMDEKRVPLMAVASIINVEPADADMDITDAVDVFALSDEDAMTLMLEILGDASIVIAELESVFPEFFAE